MELSARLRVEIEQDLATARTKIEERLAGREKNYTIANNDYLDQTLLRAELPLNNTRGDKGWRRN